MEKLFTLFFRLTSVTFQHGSTGSTLLLCQSCHAMPLSDGDGQMVHLITCQVHFRSACSSSECFQGRLPRWFCVTNHLTSQVKLSLESLITSCVYHWPHSTKDIGIMSVETFPKLLFTLLNCSRKSSNSLSITNTFQDTGLCCTPQSLHWQWMNEARMLQIQHKMEPLGRIQVNKLLGSGLSLDFKYFILAKCVGIEKCCLITTFLLSAQTLFWCFRLHFITSTKEIMF